MLGQKNKISVRELWLQMRGIENAFRAYSDILNGLAEIAPSKYELHVDLEDAVWTVLNGPFVRDCNDPPWCKTIPAKVAANFSKLQERVGAVSEALGAVVAKTDKDREFEFYVSEVPGTSWSGQSSHSNN